MFFGRKNIYNNYNATNIHQSSNKLKQCNLISNPAGDYPQALPNTQSIEN